MAPPVATSPTPTKPKRKPFSSNLKEKISLLNTKWPLDLKFDDGWSPSQSDPNHGTLKYKCVSLLNWCNYKHLLDAALKEFDSSADALCTAWVKKPQADHDVIPERRGHTQRHFSDAERLQLLECLFGILKAQQAAHPELITPRTTTRFRDASKEPGASTVAPIKFTYSPRPGMESKRAQDEQFPDLLPLAKKPKGATVSASERMAPPPGRSIRQESFSSNSANTSFSSTTSIFSAPSFGENTNTSTQETIPDQYELLKPMTTDPGPAFTKIQDDKDSSSEYTSSSFERAVGNMLEGDILNEYSKSISSVNECLSQDLQDIDIREDLDRLVHPGERAFRKALEAAFPILPPSLRSVSIYVMYEITRVFQHVGVALCEFNAAVSPALENYDTLWKFLQDLPCLEGRTLPERCGAEVWEFAVGGMKRGGYSIVFSGSLHFSSDDKEMAIELRLDPLKIDQSHRLGRRLGNDRFFEICMPPLTHKLVPRSVSRLKARAHEIFYDWLVESEHLLLGRTWKPFFVKPKERKEKKSRKRDADKDREAEAMFRVYFFAVDGHEDKAHGISSASYRAMSIPNLLNMIRPTKQNSKQSYLKLFSRTSLAVSRNHDTIILSSDQIRIRDRDLTFGAENEVMNDGAGRISLHLANEVRLQLGLSFLPSAFQGRLGEAKGLWVVDNSHDIKSDWIEVYPSQQKWNRDNDISEDLSHRTFEVLKWSMPLKSADLNTQFLPLLMEQAPNKSAMKSSLSKILQDGLEKEVAKIREAFENPQSLRKWVREVKPNMNDKLKNGAVPYGAGMPASTEERINMLLDAGFSPLSLSFLHGQAKGILNNYCEDLKERLNITVGKSTYAYMVPDFWGVLEPGEVYMDFSSFVDEVSGFSGASLNGAELLVARSPAHFISDIQKVRSVVRAELMGLKDVIVFPTKGNPSLAAKLSGGDYDGDIAWVCWEEGIVNNFVAAEVPEVPNLVEEGYIHKDSTTYEELVRGSARPTSKWLKKSLEFNMRESMLGICTNFKEKVCYTQGSVNTAESIVLSKLLSDLVDAPKQGYSFGDEDFNRLKEKRIRIKPRMPRYMSGELSGRVEPNQHILDHLTVVTADTVKSAMVQFWKGIETPPSWDEDLVAMYNKANQRAEKRKGGEWDCLLTDLKSQLNGLKNEWAAHFNKNPSKDKGLENFGPWKIECFEKFHKIEPYEDTPFTQSLLLAPGDNEHLSTWALLKASTFFSLYRGHTVSPAVWWIAGRQLARLKADAGRNGLPHVITPSMFIIQKPDNNIIRRLVSEGHAGMFDQSGSVKNTDDLEEIDDD